MSSVGDQGGLVYLGLDVHKNSITAGVLRSAREASAEVERIFHDEESVRRLIGRCGDRSWLRVCYEAGPTGYGLYRQLVGMGVRCQVVAPSLVPTRAGDRVKTDRRDARRLARLLRAGELTAIRVPTEAEEAVRDLCRARADLLDDRHRTRKRLGAFLLRHGKVYRGGSPWTMVHVPTREHLEWRHPDPHRPGALCPPPTTPTHHTPGGSRRRWFWPARAGYGAAPQASRVLRIALARDAPTGAPWTPEPLRPLRQETQGRPRLPHPQTRAPQNQQPQNLEPRQRQLTPSGPVDKAVPHQFTAPGTGHTRTIAPESTQPAQLTRD